MADKKDVALVVQFMSDNEEQLREDLERLRVILHSDISFYVRAALGDRLTELYIDDQYSD